MEELAEFKEKELNQPENIPAAAAMPSADTHENQLPQWLFAAFIGILFSVFFLFARLAVSVILFNALLLGGSFIFLHKKAGFARGRYFAISTLILYLSIAYFRFDQGFFHFFNLLLMFMFYGLLLTPSLPFRLDQWLLQGLYRMFSGLGHLMPAIRIFKNPKSIQYRKITKSLLGLGIAAMLLTIILPLLMASDAIFGSIFGNWFQNIAEELFKIIFRTVIAAFILAYTFGQLVRTEAPAKTLLSQRRYPWDTLTVSVTLVCLNAVYAVFAFIQVKYLFIGTLLPEGMTYAQYARSGFFQLVAVTALNMLVLLLIHHFAKPHPILKGLLMFMILVTTLMGIAAFYRMHLYEMAYGFTLNRLLVYMFLIGEWFALLPIAIGVINPRFKYLEWAAIAVISLYLGYNLINLDAFIASANFERYLAASTTASESMEIDLYYLSTLSKDATPVFDHYLPLLSEKDRLELREIQDNNYDYADTQPEDEPRHWFEWRITSQ